MFLAALAFCGAARAQTPPPPAAGDRVCVVVEVAGYSAGRLDCAVEAVEDAAVRARRAAAVAEPRLTVPDASSPSVRVGVTTQGAVRQRLGSNFGTSIRPQRPPSGSGANPSGGQA